MTNRAHRLRGVLALISAPLVVAALAAPAAATGSGDGGERRLLLRAAVEDTAADTATLRLQKGVDADGETFSYVVTESSDGKDAERRGVNRARKLANAAGTGAVQQGWVDRRGVLHVEDTVDFSPTRSVVPGPTGFPPAQALPGAVGQARYSPLVELPGGIVINAPHVLNASGAHDKLVAAPVNGRATFRETEGFYEGKEIYYVSFESSAPDVAALEAATYAPRLDAAPGLGDAGGRSARSGIAPFANGQTGADNPERQGLNSALLGDGDPLNVVASRPGKGSDYSPLWDVHLGVWSDAAVAAGTNTRQVDFDGIAELGEDGVLTGPGGAPWGAIGAIVNCPVVSIEA